MGDDLAQPPIAHPPEGRSDQGGVGSVPPLDDSAGHRRWLPPVRISIPSIGVDAPVIEVGTEYNSRGVLVWETAAFAVGHHIGSANPGQGGNIILSGHLSSPSQGSVFQRLPQISLGDGVILFTEETQFLYRVIEVKIVNPDQTSVMEPTPDERLTLITCVPEGLYTHRLIVIATPPQT